MQTIIWSAIAITITTCLIIACILYVIKRKQNRAIEATRNAKREEKEAEETLKLELETYFDQRMSVIRRNTFDLHVSELTENGRTIKDEWAGEEPEEDFTMPKKLTLTVEDLQWVITIY